MNTEPSQAPAGEGESASGWIGRVIDDRYQVVEVLGEGGMGAVFVAEHLKLRKLVALKTIRAEFAGDGQAEARFAREALATAQLDHPHVASAMDFGHLPDGTAYLVIQLVRGHSLAKHLEQGPLHWRQVAELGAQIADALGAAHGAGIIHRDLKPDNILLEQRDDGSFHARVVDFGIARVSGEGGGVVADTTQPLTRMGAVIGTPGYMAPEQAVGQDIDARADLYALGVILWESVAGQRLWQGDTLTEMFARQLSGSSTALGTLLPGQVPEALSELVAQLIAPQPTLRPATAIGVRDELRRLAFSGDAVLTGTGADMRVPTGMQPAHSGMIAGTASAEPSLAGQSVAPTVAASGAGLDPQISAVLPPPTRIGMPAAVRIQDTASRWRLWLLAQPRAIVYAVGAAALLLLVLVARCACGGDDEAPGDVQAEPSPADAPAAVPVAGDKQAPAKADHPTPEPTPDAKAAEPPAPTEPSGGAEPGADVPAPFTEHARVLLTSDNRKARRKAADAIAGAKPPAKDTIPEYVRNIAWLEKSSSCEAKKVAVRKMDASGDARVLPALRLLSKTPRNTCGNIFVKRDCYACLREDLARAIGRLEAPAGP